METGREAMRSLGIWARTHRTRAVEQANRHEAGQEDLMATLTLAQPSVLIYTEGMLIMVSYRRQ